MQRLLLHIIVRDAENSKHGDCSQCGSEWKGIAVKKSKSVRNRNHHTGTGNHMPYRITQLTATQQR